MTKTLVMFTLLGIFLLLLASLTINMLCLVTRIASVEEAVGTVQVRAPGASDWKTVRKGALVRVGSDIRTSPRGRAVLRWADGSRIKLRAGCHLLYRKWDVNKVTHSSNASFQQFIGRAIFVIKKALRGRQKFEVRTPTVLAAVRGTIFDVDVESKQRTTISVLDGALDVSAGGFKDTLLPDHECAATDQGAAISPISDQRRALWDRDRGFIGPRLIVDHPDRDFATDRPEVVVAGQVEQPAVVFVNDTRTAADESGRFMITLVLREGENRLVVSARDRGRVTATTYTITYTPTSATISLSLAPGEQPGQITIAAAVADQDGKPVPDSTPLHFETTLGSIQAEARTTGGRATAILDAAGAGEPTITCHSGRASAQITAASQDIQPQPSPTAQPAEPSTPTEQPAAEQPAGQSAPPP